MASMRAMTMPSYIHRAQPIFLEPETRNFELKEVDIARLPIFYGEENEDAMGFMRAFQQVVFEIPNQGLDDNKLRKRMFPLTLKGASRAWLNGLEPESLRSWEDVGKAFFDRFSHIQRHAS